MKNKKRVIIIAEVGENHIGDITLAKRLIKEAAGAGADYVKFQSYKPENFSQDDQEYGWFRKVSLSDKAHFKLQKYANKCKIKFLSSPFSLERARFLCEGLSLKEIKIASGMLLNFPVLDYINEHAHTVFLSTGLATIKEIKKSLSHLKKVKKCYVMHCVSQYPCRNGDANLLAIIKLRDEFPSLEIGYSDHTIGSLAALAAVSLGAKVIEKHFTFDRSAKEGTDHVISLEGKELNELVCQIRKVEVLLGRPKKVPCVAEKKLINFIRNRFK